MTSVDSGPAVIVSSTARGGWSNMGKRRDRVEPLANIGPKSLPYARELGGDRQRRVGVTYCGRARCSGPRRCRLCRNTYMRAWKRLRRQGVLLNGK